MCMFLVVQVVLVNRGQQLKYNYFIWLMKEYTYKHMMSTFYFKISGDTLD